MEVGSCVSVSEEVYIYFKFQKSYLEQFVSLFGRACR